MAQPLWTKRGLEALFLGALSELLGAHFGDFSLGRNASRRH
jgi:hypothetical protein